MEKIIDAHAHLGDCFYPNGQKLIDEKGVKARYLFDIVRLSELSNHIPIKFGKINYFLNKSLISSSMRKRNASATLENWRRSIDEVGFWKSVCVSCPPAMAFEDLKKVSEREKRIIPFTGVDFDKNENFEEKLKIDVKRGARGLKLHPIIQQKRLNSKDVYHVIEAFAPHDFPVNFHCGILSCYSKKDQKIRPEHPEYGSVSDSAEMAQSFPNVKFLSTHSGLLEFNKFIHLFKNFKNVWVDVTAQPASHIKKLIKVFGPDKVVFASDWPYGDRRTMLRLTQKACNGDKSLERRIFHDNAAELLKLN